MSVPLSEVGLDRETIALDVQASVGFGRAYRTRAESQSNSKEYLFAAASCFRRAGASALLLGDRDAMISAFEVADSIYTQLESSEAYVMKALTGGEDFTSFWSFPEIKEPHELDAEGQDEHGAKLIYETLRAARVESNEPRGAFQQSLSSARALEFSGSSIGILGLPISMYLDLCSSVDLFGQTGVPQTSLTMSLAPFISAYDRAIQSASRNRSNWRLLVQRIHPAEPDIIGLLSMVHLALRPPELREALAELPMSTLCRAVLAGCMETRFPDEFGRNAGTQYLRQY